MAATVQNSQSSSDSGLLFTPQQLEQLANLMPKLTAHKHKDT